MRAIRVFLSGGNRSYLWSWVIVLNFLWIYSPVLAAADELKRTPLRQMPRLTTKAQRPASTSFRQTQQRSPSKGFKPSVRGRALRPQLPLTQQKGPISSYQKLVGSRGVVAAEGVREVWRATISSGFVEAEAIVVDAAGDVVTAGWTDEGYGVYTYTVVKLSGSLGTERWRVVFDEMSPCCGLYESDSPHAITVDAAGDVIVAGSTGDFTVVKLRGTDGTEQWRQLITGFDNVAYWARAVVVDQAGDVVVAGFLPEYYEVPDFAVVKLRGTDGTEQWRWYYGYADYVDTQGRPSVAVDATGDVAAVFNNSGASVALISFYVIKLRGSDGSPLWGEQFKGGGLTCLYAGEREWVYDVAVDAAGNAIAVGSLLTAEACAAFTVGKVAETNGAEAWRQTIKGTWREEGEAKAVAVDAAGDVLAVGDVDNISTASDSIVVKLSGATGTETWRHTMNSGDWAEAIAVDAAGDVVAGGGVGSNFGVVKLRGVDGTERWRYELADEYEVIGVAIDSAGDVIAAGGSTVVKLSDRMLIQVPGDYATIQQAIDAASDGTQIHVAPGTYTESLDFKGKRLSVIADQGPTLTSIQAPEGLSAVNLHSNEPRGALLQNFTVTCGGVNCIAISDASPTITGNIIQAQTPQVGTGIFITNGKPLIKGNTISGWQQGIAISSLLRYKSEIISNTVSNNTTGIVIEGNGSEWVERNVIVHNLEDGIRAQGAGRGVMQPQIIHNTIADNLGDGVEMVFPSNPTLVGNIIADNGLRGVYENGFFSDFPPHGYNDLWGNNPNFDDGNMIPGPGVDELSLDPQFLDHTTYQLQATSPCIDTGWPYFTDPDGTRSDIGALFFDQSTSGSSKNGKYRPQLLGSNSRQASQLKRLGPKRRSQVIPPTKGSPHSRRTQRPSAGFLDTAIGPRPL